MNISEITNSLKNNKLRTFLTGFSIAWGITILIMMLGVGDGVEKGIHNTMSAMGVDRIQMSIELNTTDKAYGGYARGRQLYLRASQLQQLRDHFSAQVYAIEPTYKTFSELETEFGAALVDVRSFSAGQQGFAKLQLVDGRYFTPREHQQGERAGIITENLLSKLFVQGQKAIGSMVTISGITFRIVGVCKTENPFGGTFYIPYNTYAGIYSNNIIDIRQVVIYPRTTDPTEMSRLERSISDFLFAMLRVDPTDTWAIEANSSVDMEKGMNTMFSALSILLWVMGIGSLSIGTIGVSNIMSVTVQERIREFGIRKSIGAKPRDILSLVLGESLFLSLSSGIIGIALGYGLLQLVGNIVDTTQWATRSIPMGPGSMFTFTLFETPSVDLSIAIGALIVLVVAGLIAGYGPARKAIKIPAITAMRDTK